MAKGRLLYVIAAILLILVVATTTVTMSWFMRTSETGAHMQMGKVSIFADETQFDLGALSGRSLVKSTHFNITNDSTAESYLRIGYTFTFQDQNGEDVAFDMRDGFVDVRMYFLTIDGKSRNDFVQDCGVRHDINGYKKDFVELLTPKDGGNKYILVPPGDNATIECNITFNYDFSVYTAEEIAEFPSTLKVVLIPEAIQASRNAVTNAQAYGWDPAKVGEQAAGVSQ